MPSREDVIDALRVVEDGLGMDIVELGLLYDAEVEGPKVHVTYSLASMGCPVGPMIEQQIQEVVEVWTGSSRWNRAHLGTAMEPRADVRRREVHSRLRLGAWTFRRGADTPFGRCRRPQRRILGHGLSSGAEPAGTSRNRREFDAGAVRLIALGFSPNDASALTRAPVDLAPRRAGSSPQAARTKVARRILL